jgi:cytochrome c oxidase subunit 1
VTGGLSGIFLGQPQLDAYFHDTYFVVAHFHLAIGTAALFGIFAATFYWFPIVFGRMINETLGKVHFYLTFVLAHSSFGPIHFAGFAGNPRRYSEFTTFDFLRKVTPLQRWNHLVRLRASPARRLSSSGICFRASIGVN